MDELLKQFALYFPELNNDVVEYSYNLVGGNGTVYNDSYLGHPYAVIDTAETPGYLTLKEN